LTRRRDDGGRGDLTDEQWLKLNPLLPPQKAHTGQPAHAHRRILNSILWLHRTGSPAAGYSRALLSSIAQSERRFYRWRQAGIWQKVWSSLMQQADTKGNIDWEVNFVDSTMVRAHQHAAGAKGGARNPGCADVALVVSALLYT